MWPQMSVVLVAVEAVPGDVAQLVTRVALGLLSRDCDCLLFALRCLLSLFLRLNRLRVGAEQNVIVVSTPSPAAARALEGLQKIVALRQQTRSISLPDHSGQLLPCVIHNIAHEHPEEYVKSLITAHGYEVLTARRLGDSKAFVITFRGKRVPYYVYVNQALLRCYPYRRTVAFCTLCHQTGHRADVCPWPPATPKCKACGASLNELQHICTPRCGLCKGPHTTASKDCPKRYLPTVYKAKNTANKSTSNESCRSHSPSPGSRRNRGPHRSSSRPSRDKGHGPQHGRSATRERSTTRERPPSQSRNRGTTPVTQRKPPRDQRSTSCSVNTGTKNHARKTLPRSVTAIQHPLPLARAPGILLELLPAKGSKNSLPMFHLNVYCRPKCSPQALNDTLEVARKKAGRHQLIVSGDFNAAHPLWGYAYANPRGNYLHKYIDDKAWVILNELNIPTRTGTSTCRDTTPDLSLSNKQVACVWRNKQEALGSDHSIIENVISGPELVRTVGRASLTDWVDFRKMRSSRHTEDIPDPMEEDQYSAWITQLIQDQATCTTKLHTKSDFKVIYRPRDGLRLASWSDRQITAGVQLASKIPGRAFNQQVTVQVQAIQNLIVTSTPNEECAAALWKVTSIILGAATYNLQPYLKHFPGTVRGTTTLERPTNNCPTYWHRQDHG
ncbi:hypothetical protein HPB48_013646 [Haemaphysalis longicornis]|uniref:Endonuclease/exonuclease/phosphatase domain-containing protein n=1 Tax=Haemaphysalis longicornis TaxID=44386 RepID=A0A9J6FWK4_HAELO|nr:hypothetical protein HPB48_013646 [Haemaphysalis longicornis]